MLIERAQFTDAIGGAKHGHAAGAGVAVSGIGGIEVITAADPAHRTDGPDSIIDQDGAITRNPKDTLDADFAKPIDCWITVRLINSPS
jgi:hypothetical protein